MKVISVNIGEKKVINYKGKIIETGIFKYPVNHSVFLGIEHVKNDKQLLKEIKRVSLNLSFIK